MRPDHTQRWRDRCPRWRPVRDGGFDPDRYEVVELDEPTAARFVAAHHYAPTLPSTTRRYGLRDHHADDGPVLVGVATLGVPMSRSVLTNVFPALEPYREALDFNRLVLRETVPCNGESWFCARVFRHVAEQYGVRGVVTFADPVPRWRITNGRPELIKPGHVGIVYQALGFSAVGRSTPRSLVVLPDATVLSARAMAKVTGGERGANGVIARLVALGAPAPGQVDLAQLRTVYQPPFPPDAERSPRLWLGLALHVVGARRVRHPGNYRYALPIGTRAQRTRTVIALAALPYPKPDPELPLPGISRVGRRSPAAASWKVVAS